MQSNAAQGGFFTPAAPKSREELFRGLRDGEKSEQGQQQPSSSINAQNNTARQQAVERGVESTNARGLESTAITQNF